MPNVDNFYKEVTQASYEATAKEKVYANYDKDDVG